MSKNQPFTAPLEVLRSWMKAVNDGDADQLVGLYDETAVLIPTFSNRVLARPELIRDYFLRLAAREDLSIALHDKTVGTQPVREDVYGLFGIYCWRFVIDGESLSFEARFSYLLDLGRTRPILHHHSSQIPRML